VSPESVAQAVVAIVTPLVTLLGLASRKRRLRAEIRENLELVQRVTTDNTLAQHTPLASWLHGKIIIDVARLTGQNLGTPKKPIEKGTLITSAILAAGSGVWTYFIDRDGFVWYSVFPGIGSFLMIMAVAGTLSNREIPPDQIDALPPGATPLASGTAAEQVTSAVTLAAEGLPNDRFKDEGTVGVALRFLRAMRGGRYIDGLELVSCAMNSWCKS
jgi:hypothetical protein